ncbi:MAG: c-type cytochrome domain-containing protein, partial [Verrucomicrobiales bacterium]
MPRIPLFYPFGFLLALASGALAEKDIDFNRDVRPILSQNCFACHGPDSHERKAKLRLDTEAGSRDALTPGNPSESEMIERILSSDAEERMPPPKHGKSVSPAETEVLRKWITQGAKYSAPWAYVAPIKHPTPAVEGAWSYNWIDRFILDRLEAEGLQHSPDSDPVTLVRRLHFDLTGLPPTPQT